MIDLVTLFNTYATTAGYGFAYGRKDIQNWELTANVTLSAGKSVIMLFPFIEEAEIDNSLIFKWNVSTQIWLGKKFDTSSLTGTFSQLDETEKQKYDRRLKGLRDSLATYIKAIFCAESELELIRFRLVREINQFDENLDFVAAEINFLANDS